MVFPSLNLNKLSVRSKELVNREFFWYSLSFVLFMILFVCFFISLNRWRFVFICNFFLYLYWNDQFAYFIREFVVKFLTWPTWPDFLLTWSDSRGVGDSSGIWSRVSISFIWSHISDRTLLFILVFEIPWGARIEPFFQLCQYFYLKLPLQLYSLVQHLLMSCLAS